MKFSRLTFWSLKAENDELARTFAKTVAMAIFGRGEDVVTPEQIAHVCRDLPGITVDRIKAAAADSTAKRAVITALEAAVADGMVGAPYFVLDGEPFWGADRMDQLETAISRKVK